MKVYEKHNQISSIDFINYVIEKLDLLYLIGHKVKSVFAFKINFEKCQEKKGITP